MGRAMALAFAQEGAKVAALDVEQAGIEQLREEIAAAGGEALAVPCDVSEPESVAAAVEHVTAGLGEVEILVNNAGVLRTTTPAEEISIDEWHQVMAVNLTGVFLLCRAVLPAMRQRRSGKIINISSSAGRSTSELGGAHYTASKTAVLGLTRHLAREYAGFGINVNALCPGLVETPMIREEAPPERLQHWLEQIPAGRFAEPAEAADVVLFLASEAAAYLNGASVDFNGASLLL